MNAEYMGVVIGAAGVGAAGVSAALAVLEIELLSDKILADCASAPSRSNYPPFFVFYIFFGGDTKLEEAALQPHTPPVVGGDLTVGCWVWG
eukprot:NODE_5346_length_414_cov_22.704110_g4666_i0.p1 GENE.NODE_5346_length_414_cov_22.704110_g4666_i0~~NODE_5346_length_414_cov_22.704110_g4666_i0.p1  ORF type:complete len:91 (-),score=25.73 NODE_5346_length_414_cov_22.704110_g4666_i0:140-412(-)